MTTNMLHIIKKNDYNFRHLLTKNHNLTQLSLLISIIKPLLFNCKYIF